MLISWSNNGGGFLAPVISLGSLLLPHETGFVYILLLNLSMTGPFQGHFSSDLGNEMHQEMSCGVVIGTARWVAVVFVPQKKMDPNWLNRCSLWKDSPWFTSEVSEAWKIPTVDQSESTHHGFLSLLLLLIFESWSCRFHMEIGDVDLPQAEMPWDMGMGHNKS